MLNKKGNMFTTNIVFVLTSLFGLGILTLLVINPVFESYIKPALLATSTGAMHTMLEGKYAFISSMLQFVPYILFATAIIYILILIFRKEQVQYYD
jgi:hypothetical protein